MTSYHLINNNYSTTTIKTTILCQRKKVREKVKEMLERKREGERERRNRGGEREFIRRQFANPGSIENARFREKKRKH